MLANQTSGLSQNASAAEAAKVTPIASALPSSSTIQNAAPYPSATSAAPSGTAPAPASQPRVSFAMPTRPDVEFAAAEKQTVSFDTEKITSKISRTSRHTGSIHSTEGFQIDGRVDGDITCESGTVLITEGAVVNGIVTAQRVIVLGMVGDETMNANKCGIKCPGHLIVAETAIIRGFLEAKTFSVYAGAQIEGVIRTNPK